MKLRKKWIGAVLALGAAFFLGASPLPALAMEDYTVTANLYVPGDLNSQLPGVTAYLTNGNNPLGEGGYEAVAPTTPVSGNATATVADDGSVTVKVPVPNPVFTLQKIGGCSNATINAAPQDKATYATQDGKVSRQGRITSITVALGDRSGKYVFTDCTEFPTLLGVDWTVPLTLEVDLSALPEPKEQEQTRPEEREQSKEQGQGAAAQQQAKVNVDGLQAILTAAEQNLRETKVSADGSDVDPALLWVSQQQADGLQTAIATARAKLQAADQATVDEAAKMLTAINQEFVAARKAGSKMEETAPLGKTLKPGSYTVSANIWFSKEDTTLPLNPHITNDTFPPMNPVPDNGTLVIDQNGQAKVTIPVVIQDKVMTVREIRDLKLLDVQKLDTGAISEITVDLGKLSGDSTVQQWDCTADIEMGDLAMSISGLEKPHTWPATFELNLSGVATTDGGTMPTVELVMLDASAASEAMAQAGAQEAQEPEPEPEPESKAPSAGMLAVIAVATVVAAVAATVTLRKRH